MSIQALILPALAVLHNFIRQHDPDEIQMYDNNNNNNNNNNEDNDGPLELELQMGPQPESVGELGIGPVTREETLQANER